MSEPNPQDEIKSLAGRIDLHSMGTKLEKDKPKNIKAQPVEGSQGIKKKSKAKEQGRQTYKSGDILEEKFTDQRLYRPKTKQNIAVYQVFLGKINDLIEDQPPEVLLALADETLAILKSTAVEKSKKSEIETLLSIKFSEDTFVDLSNIVKGLSDYGVEEGDAAEEIVNIEEEEENEDEDSNGQIVEEVVGQDEKEDDRDEAQIHKKEMMHDIEEIKEQLDSSEITMGWLMNKLSKYLSAEEASEIVEHLLPILALPSTLQAENSLLSLFNYQHMQLVKLLLEERWQIYYAIRYANEKGQKERVLLRDEMLSKGIKIKGDNAKEDQKDRRDQVENMEEEIGLDQNKILITKDDELLRMPRKIIDLSIHSAESSSPASNYKFVLPSSAEKSSHLGYEQVVIPPQAPISNASLIEIDTLPEWMQIVFSPLKKFNPIQSQVLKHALGSKQNMLVCAPTSAGKTNVALLSILEVVSRYYEAGSVDLTKFKIVYIAPMKALVSEITGNLSNRLKSLSMSVHELTGDIHLSASQIAQTSLIVTTPEKWDIITRKSGDKALLDLVKLVIIDEIHLLSDGRGPVLEAIIARNIRMGDQGRGEVRMIGLSATLPNYHDVAHIMRVPPAGLFFFSQAYRPIPLTQKYLGLTEKSTVRRMLLTNQLLYSNIMQRLPYHQIIIFVHSRRDTFRTGNTIRQTAYGRDELARILRPESESKKIIDAILEREKEGFTNKELKELVAYGIGIHHAGLPRGDRSLVQELFANRHLSLLISTSTLAWGVNLPAHTVILKSTQFYNPQTSSWQSLSLQDLTQMLGRAGRPHYDQEGEGIIISTNDEVRDYIGKMNLLIPLQSEMMNSLVDMLNAEIVGGTVNGLKDAVNWLSYTFLFVRMLKNPKHYSIPSEQLAASPSLLPRRLNLAHSVFSLLQRHNLITYARQTGQVSSTYLGRIAAHYYVKYGSMGVYVGNLRGSSSIADIIRVFGMSAQFKWMGVREQERNELKKLMETVPIPIKGSLQDSTTKISALLQAHISRLSLAGYALNIDKLYVTQTASRLLRALFEIALKKNWASTALSCLQLCKMVDRSMWSCLNPLRQFKEIPEYVLARLQKKEQFSWQSFYSMTPVEIGELTKFPKLGKILHKYIHHIPRLALSCTAKPLTRSSLLISLKLTSNFKWDDLYHPLAEPFHIFVNDCNEENILHHELIMVSRNEEEKEVEIYVPLMEVMHPLYYVRVVSDRWICGDAVLPVSFRVMRLPAKFQAQRELEDGKAIGRDELGELGKTMKISQLNQIQSQCWQEVTKSDENLLILATPGSGKLSLAMFAVQQCLASKKKAVILLSHESEIPLLHPTLSLLFPKHAAAQLTTSLAVSAQMLASHSLLIGTPKEWDILSRRWKARKGWNEIGLIVVEGVEKLEDDPTIQIVLARMRYIQSLSESKPFRMITLGISIANYKELAEFLGVPSHCAFSFSPTVRPHPLQLVFSAYDQPLINTRLALMQKHLFHLLNGSGSTVNQSSSLASGIRSCIVVVEDEKRAKEVALEMVGEIAMSGKKWRKISDEQLRQFTKKISDPYLQHMLDYGIGYLSSTSPAHLSPLLLSLLHLSAISMLIVPFSMIHEIQPKASIVALLQTRYWNGQTGRYQEYRIPDVMKIMGWCSNEKKREVACKFVVYCHSSRKAFYKKFISQPYPLESGLPYQLPTFLNSSITSASTPTPSDAIDWLTWTFLYRRLPVNPSYYSLEDASEEGISAYLSELIQNTVEYLQGVKCVQREQGQGEERYTATNLGIICSYYYIHVETMGSFISKVHENMKIKDVIQAICSANELKAYSSYKPNEYQMIAQLLIHLTDQPTSKAHALLLLHMHRIPLPAVLSSLFPTFLPIVTTLIHAFIDVISSFGYLKPLVLAMQLAQMVAAAMWFGDSQIKQVVDDETAKKLEEKGVKTIGEIADMDDHERDSILKGKDVEKIATACNRFPSMTLTPTILSASSTSVQLSIRLARDTQPIPAAPILPHYPAPKQEFWFLILASKPLNRVLATKKVSVDQEASVEMTGEIGDEGWKGGKVWCYALCDCYVGADVVEQVEIKEDE